MTKPPKPPSGANRIPLMVRTSPDFRERLEAAATASGRSLAQEAELRLERSFADDHNIEVMARFMGEKYDDLNRQMVDQVVSLAGGDDLFMLWSKLSWSIQAVEHERGKSIRDDDETRHEAERRVLGDLPGVFRSLPPRFSEFKRQAAENAAARGPQVSGLAALGTGLAPLGHKGPWPPIK